MKKIILYLVLLFIFVPSFAQINPDTGKPFQTPNGYLDNVFDRYGNKYNLEDIRVVPERKLDGLLSKNYMLCSSGIFELYFETGSGMEDVNNATHNARRAVVCQVFQDLSNFINSPLKIPGNPAKVKIWIRNLSSLNDVPSGTLGTASSFYNLAFNTNPNFGGIGDSEVWKTITLGADSYTNTSSPVSVGNSYYHGMMAFNFNSINWNTNLSINAPTGSYDLYTVVLHEVAHVLGIASLMNESGLSVFSSGYNYFSRYDTFLKNNATSKFLITNTGSCSLYNYKFNTTLNPSILHPSGNCVTDQTTCSSAIKFVGTNTIPVYTPNCFEEGSSLSHFEDQCVSPYVNNAYFTLSNANGTGVTKRFLKPEERMALCDIGYSVNTVYGTSGLLSYKNYGGSTCSGNTVAGMNDGISTEGEFTLIGNSGANISINNILSNDFTTNISDLRFECLQDVYDSSAIISVTTGNATTPITFSSTTPGIHLLRYVPYSNTTQKRGNITYIYVYVKYNNNCAIPDSCNLVVNGDFEQYSDLPNGFSQLYKACGWSSGYTFAPHYFHEDVSSVYPNLGVPCNIMGSQNDNVIGNKGYTSFAKGFFSGVLPLQNVLTKLTSPLLPNTTYQLSFDVSRAERGTNRYIKPQAYFSMTNTVYNSEVVISNPAMFYETAHFPTNADGWENIKMIVTTGNISGEQYLYLGVLNNTQSILTEAVSVDCLAYGGSAFTAAYYLDNVELIPLNGAALNLPEDFCLSTTLSNLSQYIVAAPANGVFSGPGVTQSGSNYSFSAATAGVGTHTISYTYTNSSGCVVSISSQITVVDCGPGGPGGSCPEGLVFTNYELGPDVEYQAGTIVTHTKYYVPSGVRVRLTAEQSVTLDPMSFIESGSDFIASISECSSISSKTVKTETLNPKNALEIYPNPTKGFVKISANGLKISSIVVNYIDGKTIHSQSNINSISYDFTLENLPIGFYSVIVQTVDGQIIFGKIIKD